MERKIFIVTILIFFVFFVFAQIIFASPSSRPLGGKITNVDATKIRGYEMYLGYKCNTWGPTFDIKPTNSSTPSGIYYIPSGIAYGKGYPVKGKYILGSYSVNMDKIICEKEKEKDIILFAYPVYRYSISK